MEIFSCEITNSTELSVFLFYMNNFNGIVLVLVAFKNNVPFLNKDGTVYFFAKIVLGTA